MAKRSGTVQSGPYAGQLYKIISATAFSRWYSVVLFDHGSLQDENAGDCVQRDIREECLEK